MRKNVVDILRYVDVCKSRVYFVRMHKCRTARRPANLLESTLAFEDLHSLVVKRSQGEQ